MRGVFLYVKNKKLKWGNLFMEKKQKLIGKSGVYAWLVNDEIKYIGSTGSNLESRKSNHLGLLRGGDHKNKQLQELFDKYGEVAFKFRILDLCDADSHLELERLHMLVHQDTLVKQNEVISLNRKVRTAEEKQKLSEKLSKANSGKNNPNARLTEQEAKEIIQKKQAGVKHKELAELYSVSKSQIAKIGKSKWGYIA